MSSNLNFWKPIVGESWYNNCQNIFDNDYMGKIMSFLVNAYKTSTVYPLQKNVFKPFILTPFDKVRVVIIGTEPYTTSNGDVPTATGLAFANDEDNINLSPELRNIHRAVELYCYDGLKVNFDITLEEWAEQGVLLLNSSLTVNKYKPGSHSSIWIPFVEEVIKSLNSNTNGLHFVFWGEGANRFKPLVNGLFHYIYEFESPSKVKTLNYDWKCTHFKDINMNIIQQNGIQEVIAW